MTLSTFLQWSGGVADAIIALFLLYAVIVLPGIAFIQALSRLGFEVYCLRSAGKKLPSNAIWHAVRCIGVWTWDRLMHGATEVVDGPHTWDGTIWYGRWHTVKKGLDKP